MLYVSSGFDFSAHRDSLLSLERNITQTHYTNANSPNLVENQSHSPPLQQIENA